MNLEEALILSDLIPHLILFKCSLINALLSLKCSITFIIYFAFYLFIFSIILILNCISSFDMILSQRKAFQTNESQF